MHFRVEERVREDVEPGLSVHPTLSRQCQHLAHRHKGRGGEDIGGQLQDVRCFRLCTDDEEQLAEPLRPEYELLPEAVPKTFARPRPRSAIPVRQRSARELVARELGPGPLDLLLVHVIPEENTHRVSNLLVLRAASFGALLGKLP